MLAGSGARAVGAFIPTIRAKHVTRVDTPERRFFGVINRETRYPRGYGADDSAGEWFPRQQHHSLLLKDTHSARRWPFMPRADEAHARGE